MFNYSADFPFHRGRRLRKNSWIRDLVAENYVSVNDLIWPIFVVEGENKIEPNRSRKQQPPEQKSGNVENPFPKDSEDSEDKKPTSD